MYAYSMDVLQPLESYDEVHAEVERRLGGKPADGCLLHLVTRIDGGFRVTEVWESREAADRFSDEHMREVIGSVMGPEAVAAGPPPAQELDVHHLQRT